MACGDLPQEAKKAMKKMAVMKKAAAAPKAMKAMEKPRFWVWALKAMKKMAVMKKAAMKKAAAAPKAKRMKKISKSDLRRWRRADEWAAPEAKKAMKKKAMEKKAEMQDSPPSWASVLRPTMSLGSGSASDIAVMRDVEEEEEEEEEDDDVEAQ